MFHTAISRRRYMTMLGTAAGVAGMPAAAAEPGDATRAARMKWWHEARFGMFVHWGLYSVLGRHEWAMETEGIPVGEYEQLARRFNPAPNCMRTWAKLAKQAGQKYVVMTTKHHEGFCLFESKLTDYCAPKHAAGRDLVREYVDAVRAEGLRVGFYYSLMDWHHPDGERCARDEAARRRFVAYIHGQIRELLTNYGKIDVLWYDMPWPLETAGAWESEKMNRMVFELQPDIIVNNRNRLNGDFSTPEQRIEAERGTRAWESCMTMNESWGFNMGDDAWKSPKTIVRNLATCSHDAGNYLLNIGPHPDGSVPEQSARTLAAVGAWMQRNADTVYGGEPCKVRTSQIAGFTRKGNTLHMHVWAWPGEPFGLGGLDNKVVSARFLATGQPVKFTQDSLRVRFTGLPVKPPDAPVTVIALECNGEPAQNMSRVRVERTRKA